MKERYITGNYIIERRRSGDSERVMVRRVFGAHPYKSIQREEGRNRLLVFLGGALMLATSMLGVAATAVCNPDQTRGLAMETLEWLDDFREKNFQRLTNLVP